VPFALGFTLLVSIIITMAMNAGSLNHTTDMALKESGRKMEYKSWTKSSFEMLLNGDQAKNQLKAIIHDCVRYLLFGDALFVTDKNGLNIYSLTSINAVQVGEIKGIKGIEFIGHFETMIIFKDENGHGYKIDMKNQKTERLIQDEHIFLHGNLNDNLIPIYSRLSIYDPRKGGLYDLASNSIRFLNHDCKASKFIDNLFVGKFGGKLYLSDIVDGTELWQFSIANFPNYINGFCREQEADIKQVIGVYNNILWVHVGGFRLVGIDIETGKQLHYIEDIPYALGLTKEERYHFDFSSFGGYAIHLDDTRGILKAFAHRYYIEIDLNTLKGSVKKDFGEDWKNSWRIKNSTYYQEYPELLFFSGNYKNIHNPNAFGIFDTEKAEIIWHNTTKDDMGYFYNPPQANDKLLAVLDDKHNLLIYDREDTITNETTNKNTAPPKTVPKSRQPF
jgi:hypothetical protein